MKTKHEIERKFLVRAADLQAVEGLTLNTIHSVYLDIENINPVDLSEMLSTTITSMDDNVEIRLSRVANHDDSDPKYWAITKVGEHAITRAEAISEITEEMFEKVSEKLGIRELKKARFTFDYLRNTFELDVIDNGSTMILEIELEKEEQLFALPPFIDIVKEVTGDTNYYSYTLAAERE